MVEEEEDKFIKENPVVFKKYKVKKKLGEGAFGDVYLGQTIENNSYVALKVEQRKIVKPILESEAFLLYSIAGIGIPEVKSFGKVKNYNILVEPLLGKSLFDIFAENHKEMPLEDVCLIGKQVIDRIQWVHSKYIVHRDIKPDNFLIGKKDPNVIYLIDFGLSKKYRSSTTNKHIRFGFTGKLTGTVRFASANALRGGEQSRRDDIESIGYMLVYFLKKKLPWQGITGRKKMERYLKIYKMKKNTSPEELCSGLFPEMVEYVSYSKKLEFEQEPDYNYLRKLFGKMLKRVNNTKDQLIFSWIKLADLPNLKNPINPASRRDSPQSRIYKKIKSNLEKERNLSSDSDSKNGSYQQVYNQASVPTSNLKLVDSNNNFTESEFEQKTDKKLLKAKEGLNTTIANLDVTVDENVVDFENERMKRASKDLGNFNESNNNSIKKTLTNKNFPLKSKFQIEEINNNNYNNNTDNTNTQKNLNSDFKNDLDNNNNNNNNNKNNNNNNNNNNRNSNNNNIDIERNLNNDFKNDLDINNIKDLDDNIDSLPNDNEDILDNKNTVFNNQKSNELNKKINNKLNSNNDKNNNSGNKIQNITQNVNSNNNNINSNNNFNLNKNNGNTNINIKMNNFDGTEFTFNEPLDFNSNLNINKISKNITDVNMKGKSEKKNENLDNDKNNIYALITGNTQYINNNNIIEFNKNSNYINKFGNEQNADNSNNFHSEKKIAKVNEFEKGNSSNKINNYSSKEMNYLNQIDINNPQNNYKKFNNIKNRVEVKKVNRNKYNSKTMNNNQDMNNTYNNKTLKMSLGMNNNNNSNNSYNKMNIDFLNNLNRQNNRETPNNFMNKPFSNEKNINYNNKNTNKDLNKMNYDLFPNDGDINNNQMMNQSKKGYNNSNRQGKDPNMHKKNKMGEIQLNNGLNNNELFNKTGNGQNNLLGYNNDIFYKNKALEKSNKMGRKNKMFDLSNTEIGNNKYMGSNYNYPINNKNQGYSNTEENINNIYGYRKMLNKNKMNNNNYMKQMDYKQNNVNPNSQEAILSKGSEDINNNYSNNSKDNNMFNNNYIKKINSNDSNTINNNTNVVKLDSYKFNSPKNSRLNGKKVTKIRKLNDNEGYHGYKNLMSQSMTNNNINNKLQNNYQMTGYINKNAYNNEYTNNRGSFHPSAGKLNTGINNQKYFTLNSSQNQSNRNFQIGGISPLYSNIKPMNYNMQGNFQSNSMYGFKI